MLKDLLKATLNLNAININVNLIYLDVPNFIAQGIIKRFGYIVIKFKNNSKYI